jgi:acyl-homoserine-lactone acylase
MREVAAVRSRLLVSAALTAVLLGPLALVSGPDSTAAAQAKAASPAAADRVAIVTDSAGIPHITASSYESLGYGEAYAFAGDSLCTLAQDFVTVNGQRSRYFGPAGLAVNYSTGTAATNLDSDMFWQAIKQSGLYARESRAPAPIGPLPQVKQIFEGYVKGYNAYLRSGQLHDPACAGKPWVRPITLKDLFLRWLQIATASSSQVVISDEAAAVPPSASPATAAAAARGGTAPLDTAALRALRESGNSSNGSNGIAVGRQDTQASDGLVLANPHFPWQGTERFWMAQLTLPGGYNVEGGTLMGFPLIGIGFNSDIAWTHTVSTSERFTFFQLKLVPGDPTSYYVNGRATPMGQQTVTVDTGAGSVRHTFYTTRWGTVMVLPDAGYGWTTSVAYTMDDANLGDEWRAADQYFEMGRATSAPGLLGVEEKYLATPSFNTIAADDHGKVLYADVGNTPNVSSELIKACLPPGQATLVYEETGLITLDGSTTDCAWGTDKGTPVPGIFDGSQMPHTIRSDYVENSNDSYWLANPGAPFRAYSPIIGDIGVEQGLRTRLGDEMIAERIAGTDGLGKPKFTIPAMQAMWQNDRSLLAELVLKPLVAACEKAPIQTASDGTTVDLTSACAALAGYEKYENGDLGASGGWLFSLWYFSTPRPVWAVAFDARHPLTTPNGLDPSDPGILTALADAVQNLEANHIALDASFGQVQHATRGDTVIPIHGCSDAIGCFNAINTNLGPGDPFFPGDYGEVGHGSSMVLTTELTASGPVSQGILTYSQATNPMSPWYANMTKLFSQKRWVHLPYTPAQLAAQTGNQTVVLRS